MEHQLEVILSVISKAIPIIMPTRIFNKSYALLPNIKDVSKSNLWVVNNTLQFERKWNPYENLVDVLKLSLDFCISITRCEESKTVTVSYTSPLGNPGQLRDTISSSYADTGDYYTVTSRLVIKAAFEISKAVLFKRVNISFNEIEELMKNDKTN